MDLARLALMDLGLPNGPRRALSGPFKVVAQSGHQGLHEALLDSATFDFAAHGANVVFRDGSVPNALLRHERFGRDTRARSTPEGDLFKVGDVVRVGGRAPAVVVGDGAKDGMVAVRGGHSDVADVAPRTWWPRVTERIARLFVRIRGARTRDVKSTVVVGVVDLATATAAADAHFAAFVLGLMAPAIASAIDAAEGWKIDAVGAIVSFEVDFEAAALAAAQLADAQSSSQAFERATLQTIATEVHPTFVAEQIGDALSDPSITATVTWAFGGEGALQIVGHDGQFQRARSDETLDTQIADRLQEVVAAGGDMGAAAGKVLRGDRLELADFLLFTRVFDGDGAARRSLSLSSSGEIVG